MIYALICKEYISFIAKCCLRLSLLAESKGETSNGRQNQTNNMCSPKGNFTIMCICYDPGVKLSIS